MGTRAKCLKIAVIGSGISGLSAAYRLDQNGHHVSLFEAADYFGGHSHTVQIDLGGVTYGVDTGFLVFNHKTYPQLVDLFKELEIETVATDMSFSVKCALATRTLEWAGGNLNTVFAQRRNLFNPRFLRMVRDILRFNQAATALAVQPWHEQNTQSLGQYLGAQAYSSEFRDWYLLPMAGCIWSCPTAQMLDFPLATFIHFCHNHGLLQVNDRPQWQTVKGGSRHYVEKMIARIADKRLQCPVQAIRRENGNNGVQICVQSKTGSEYFDHVILATHSDQSLRLLQDTSTDEHQILAAVGYQANHAVLHTDTACLPRNKKTWSAWNYQSKQMAQSQVCVHYLINLLQPLPFKESVLVSLNPIEKPDPAKVLGRFDYAHPVFDAAAIAAQTKLAQIQGVRNTWFAGAWTGYGFHEDGLKSGLAVAKKLNELSLQNA